MHFIPQFALFAQIGQALLDEVVLPEAFTCRTLDKPLVFEFVIQLATKHSFACTRRVTHTYESLYTVFANSRLFC